ncbi:hypothetical protein PAMP_024073 [Pampus punctatissimus]
MRGLTAGHRTGSGKPSGVQPDSHLWEVGTGGDRVWFRGAVLLRLQSCSQLSIVSRTGEEGRGQDGSAQLSSARLGPAGCSSTRRSCRLRSSAAPAALVSSQGRGTVAELGLQSVSSRSADIPLGEGVGSVSVPYRRAAASACHLSFSRQKGRGCRKEGGKEENAQGMLGAGVHVPEASRLNGRFKDFTSRHASEVQVGRSAVMTESVQLESQSRVFLRDNFLV